MSYTLFPLRKARLQRSELAVPGSNPTMIEKAVKSAADYIFLDCEDAVAPPDKEQARKNIIQALNDIDWRGAGKTVSVRINGLDTHYMYRDVVDIMEQAGSKLDTILIPKVGVPADVYTVECIVSQIEVAKGFTNRVATEALIETPLGMANVEAIAAAPSRLEAMHFGVADYAEDSSDASKAFGKVYRDAVKVAPDNQSSWPYDAINVLCAAINKAGSTDSGKIREAILATKKFPGAEGEYNFDQNGDGLHGYNIVKNDKGNITFDKHIEFTD